MNRTESNSTTATAPTPAGQPAEGVRTTVSMLLFLHLAALAIGVASSAMPLSGLRNKLGDVPVRAYLAMLHMDLAYNYSLTPRSEPDKNDPLLQNPFVENVELELNWQRVTNPDATRITLPAPDVWPGIRRQRFRNLAHVVAGQIGDQDFEGVLPLAVARALLADAGITEGTHRFRSRRQTLVDRHQAHSIDPADSDPGHATRFTNVYEADVVFFRGEASLVKAVAAGQAAPVQTAPPVSGEP